MTPDLKTQIEHLIQAYCAESAPEPLNLKRLAHKYQLLPILIDWAGFFGLRCDGEIFVVVTEEETKIQPERDERIRRVAIFQGTKKYPLLSALVPSKPYNALVCHHCEGHGYIDLPVVGRDTIVCYCGGLG